MWSVSNVNSCPYRYGWNFSIPQTTARYSSSEIEWFLSEVVNFLLAYAISTGIGEGISVSCNIMAPSPVIDASEHSMNGQVVRQMEHWAFSQAYLQ